MVFIEDVSHLYFLYFILCVCAKDCSDFQAGSEIPSKGRFDALDETAVFGICCPPGFLMKFLNLKGGERYLPLILLYQVDLIPLYVVLFYRGY